MKQHDNLQILKDCSSEQVFPILTEKSGDRPARFHLPNNSHSRLYTVTKVCSACFGKLHFCLAWWMPSAAHVPGGQIWRAGGTFAPWGSSCERCPGTVPVSSAQLFVWSRAQAGRRSQPRHGHHQQGCAALNPFPIRKWARGPWAAELAACWGKAAPHGAQSQCFSALFCWQNIRLWEILPQIRQRRFPKAPYS